MKHTLKNIILSGNNSKKKKPKHELYAIKLSCRDGAWNITSPWSPIQFDSVPLSFRYFFFVLFNISPQESDLCIMSVLKMHTNISIKFTFRRTNLYHLKLTARLIIHTLHWQLIFFFFCILNKICIRVTFPTERVIILQDIVKYAPQPFHISENNNVLKIPRPVPGTHKYIIEKIKKPALYPDIVEIS